MRLVDTAVARRNVEQLVVVKLDPELFGERLTYLASSAPCLLYTSDAADDRR